MSGDGSRDHLTRRAFASKAMSLTATVSGLLAPWGGQARAQSGEFPTKPIRIVCATVAGSGPDVATRQMASPLGGILKVPVVVDNKPGANGMLAANEVARSAPDGYTLLDANIGNALNDLLRTDVTARLGQELIPITDLTASPLILLVNPAVPVNTVGELVAYAKAHERALNYASGGPGSLIQLTGERIKRAAGIPMTEVPYKSFGADVVDLLAGQVQVGFGVWGNIGEFVRQGKLRALAIVGQTRNPQAKDIPTLAQAGIPGIEATGWNGIFAPAGVPAPVMDTIARGMIAAVNTKAFQQFFLKDAVDIGGKTPEQFASFIRSEKENYGKIIKEANIRLQ